MGMDLYDEFGNYLGDTESETEQIVMETDGVVEASTEVSEELLHQQVVLHEDKSYYPSALATFGPSVETLVQEEDTQMLSEPIIAPKKVKQFQQLENLPAMNFKLEFMTDLMELKERIRNVAIVGHLHHGKTMLLDMLLNKSYKKRVEKYTDYYDLERERGISLKCAPVSVVLPDAKSRSHVLNLIDTPGHTDFNDEVTAALRMADGAVLVVDVLEGVMLNTETLIKQSVDEKLPIVLVLNKFERLFLELRLPPQDAYLKLQHTLEEINNALRACGSTQIISPELGNVCFTSTEGEWCFSLQSFAETYCEVFGNINASEFSKRLWGDVYYHKLTNKFRRKYEGAKNTFVEFILEPIYKIYTQIMNDDQEELKRTCTELGILMKPSDFESNLKDLMKIILKQFFGENNSLVQMITLLPDAHSGNKLKLETTISGKPKIEDNELYIQVCKMYPNKDASGFDVLGRVLSGTISKNDQIKILGKAFSLEDQEDVTWAQVTELWVYQSRHRIPVEYVTAGNLVLIGSISKAILSFATIVSADSDLLCPMKPLRFYNQSYFKMALEPSRPSELPKLIEGLSKIGKSYPMLITHVEESGEHVLFGPGELYLDCAIRDLRKVFAEIDIKISDPAVKFSETVVETSSLKCVAETPNRKNTLTFIAEPLENGISKVIEAGKVTPESSKYFQTEFGWDILAARSIWTFGPSSNGPNVLLNDSLPSQLNQNSLNHIKESVEQGFLWGTREGPLCDEPIRNVKFRLLDAQISDDETQRSGGQIIPTTRRACYSAFLTASPRLMEPVNFVEIQTPSECSEAIFTVLGRRRGHVVKNIPKPGTPFYTIKAYIPLIETFGFETDLRTHTQGQVFCQQIFDHWQIVPGDPLDKSIQLSYLEPSPAPHLARDFMLKTRRRKGLSEDVSIGKFFDDVMLMEMAKQDVLTNYSIN